MSSIILVFLPSTTGIVNPICISNSNFPTHSTYASIYQQLLSSNPVFSSSNHSSIKSLPNSVKISNANNFITDRAAIHDWHTADLNDAMMINDNISHIEFIDPSSSSTNSSTSSNNNHNIHSCSSNNASSSHEITKSKGLSYASAGVDIDAGDALIKRISSYARSTRRIGCDASLGGFAAVFDIAKINYVDPLLISCTDGVGTKLEIAKIASNHSTIGIDLVAMSVNDLIVTGAEPLFFLDYFATGKLDVDQAAQVIKGVSEACLDSECSLSGGETAEMPGLYKPGDYDIAGFAVGIVERNNLLPKLNQMEDGDILLALSSSGIHSNGFSLVRKIVNHDNIGWFSSPPYKSNHSRLCDDVLTPTRLYVSTLKPLLSHPDEYGIVGLAHITGGGIVENIPRVLPKHLSVSIDCTKWNIPPVFQWLQHAGDVDPHEMLRTFNCGIGMVIIVKHSKLQNIIEKLQISSQQECFQIGQLCKRNNANNPAVMLENIEKLFSH